MEVIFNRNPLLGQGKVSVLRLTVLEVFLRETHLRSSGACGSVRLREVSVLWDVRLKRFHCIHSISHKITALTQDFR